MKTPEIQSQNWDDLVFENRNHAYGAFAVRRAYPTSLTRAAGAGAVFIVAVLFLPSLHETRETQKEKPLTINLRENPSIVTEVNPARKMKRRIKAPSSDQIPMATASMIDDSPVLEAPLDSGSDTGDETGSDIPGTLIGDSTSTESAVVPEPPFYDNVEIMPQYDGGLEAMAKFLQKKLKYPHPSMVMGTEGTVFVRFIVNQRGEVADVEIVKGISSDCNEEARRVVGLMKSWKPGRQNNRPVNVRMILPIKFKLEN